MLPAVGKSGPFMNSNNSSTVTSLVTVKGSRFTLVLSIMKFTASITSPRLCGGILVAIPTAIPSLPIKRRFGSFAGR